MENSSLQDAKRYELMIIINSDIGQEAIENRLDALRKLLTSPGEIFHEEIWGMKNLAFPIKKQTKGYYAVFDFVGKPERIKEMNHTLGLENEVLRHLFTVLPLSYEPKDYTKEAEENASLEDTKSTDETSTNRKKQEKDTPKKGNPEKKLENILQNPDLNF